MADISLETHMDCAPAAVLAEVSDLPGYPEWHGMVKKVEVDGDGWLVDLGARFGPFAKTKRVRMVRAGPEEEQPGQVRFIRKELDREDYGDWELQCVVDPAAGEGPCTLRFRMLFEGSSPLMGMIEPMLRTEVERSGYRLRQRLAAD